MVQRINKHLPRRLWTILALQVAVGAMLWLTMSVGVWSWRIWGMSNSDELVWSVSLHRIFGWCNCRAGTDFYYICASTFKRSFATLDGVKHMFCSLPNAPLKVPEQYQEGVRNMSSACNGMQKLYTASISTFVLMLSAALCSFASIVCLLKWCKISFAKKRKRWYWASAVSVVTSTVCSGAGILVYSGAVGLKSMFSFLPATTIQPLSGGYGWGLWVSVLAFTFHFLLLFLFWKWVPRGVHLAGADDYAHYKANAAAAATAGGKKNGTKKRKNAAGKKSQDSSDSGDESERQQLIKHNPQQQQLVKGMPPGGKNKQLFWAYVPEAMQPQGTGQYLQDVQRMEAETLNNSYMTGQMPGMAQQYGNPYETTTTTYVGTPVTTQQHYIVQGPSTVQQAPATYMPVDPNVGAAYVVQQPGPYDTSAVVGGAATGYMMPQATTVDATAYMVQQPQQQMIMDPTQQQGAAVVMQPQYMQQQQPGLLTEETTTTYGHIAYPG